MRMLSFARDQNWHEPADVAQALEQSLVELQLDYGRNMPESRELWCARRLTNYLTTSGPFPDAL
jgi:hypothetical protein